MIAIEAKQLCRPSFSCGETAHTIDAFGAKVGSLQIRRVPMDTKNLFEVGEIGVADQIGAGPNAARLNAAMSFGDISVLRGEMSPNPNRRCPAGAWVGCPLR